jgi:hypothetical protein
MRATWRVRWRGRWCSRRWKRRRRRGNTGWMGIGVVGDISQDHGHGGIEWGRAGEEGSATTSRSGATSANLVQDTSSKPVEERKWRAYESLKRCKQRRWAWRYRTKRLAAYTLDAQFHVCIVLNRNIRNGEARHSWEARRPGNHRCEVWKPRFLAVSTHSSVRINSYTLHTQYASSHRALI